MAQRKKPRKNAPSRKREAQILATHKNTRGERIYNVTAGKVTKQELNYLVKVANRRLASLEKAELESESNLYQVVQHYAISGAAHKKFIYNVNMEKGTIRLSQKTKGLTSEEKAYLINVARNIVKAKTGTVKGTRTARHKAYETFMKKNKIPAGQITEDQYAQMFKIWREQISEDKKERFDSKTLKNYIVNTNMAKMLTPKQFEEAMRRADELDDPLDAMDELIMAGKISTFRKK